MGKKDGYTASCQKKEDNGNNHPLLPFPQSIPQYIEVPPHLEVKQIVSYFPAILSC